MTIPCKDCLILPICKHKRDVRCELMYQWYTGEYQSEIKLREANRYLPNWGRIIRGDNRGGIINDSTM